MCGICGVWSQGGPPGEDLDSTVLEMTRRIEHRGPDDFGVWTDPAAGVGLGHRRLSIIDLSPEGAQPMVSADGRWIIVYNGEVYDFPALRAELEAAGVRFRGHSDTEVLLEAIARFGPDAAVERLGGMFAFAAWDRRDRRLTLARDRLGKKPLYYGWSGGRFFFGSELKAFAAHPAFRGEIDRDALGLFVRFSYVPSPYSIFRGIRKLEAGSLLDVDASTTLETAAPRRFWTLPGIVEAGRADPFRGGDAEAIDALESLLREVVEMRLVSDVEVGALLSGGIDSTLVVALMQAASERRVKTFSIGYREERYDEAPFARAIAEHLGTDHREKVVTPADAMDVIPRIPSLYDEPFADTSQLPTFLVSEFAASELKVVLSGDGGDEFFAGYNRYFRTLRLWKTASRLPDPLRHGVGAALRALGGASLAGIGPDAPPSGWRSLGGRLDKAAPAFDARDVRDLFVRLSSRCDDPAEFVPGARELPTPFTDPSQQAQLEDPLDWMMHVDAQQGLREGILVKVDRASMGVSLEVRCPLLDHRVAEFSWRLPRHMKVRGGERKWLLKQVLARHVPTELTERPKKGFGVPIGDWIRGPLRDWAEDLLDARRIREQGILEADAVRRVWSQHLGGWRDRRFLLWNLLVFQAWLAERQSSQAS